MTLRPTLLIRPVPCPAQTILPLLPMGQQWETTLTGHEALEPLPFLAMGTLVGSLQDPTEPAFLVTGRAFLPAISNPCPLLKALNPSSQDTPAEIALPLSRTGHAVACITLSDKGYAGEREDRSGPAVLEQIRTTLPLCHSQGYLLPDEPALLRNLVQELAVGQGYDLIITTGGTGLAPRDCTPEALLPLFERRLPGFEQQMMQESLRITPHAALSRACAGTLGQSLILALPGSVKAARENLQSILPALPHALEKLQGDPSDCGG